MATKTARETLKGEYAYRLEAIFTEGSEATVRFLLQAIDFAFDDVVGGRADWFSERPDIDRRAFEAAYSRVGGVL